MLPLYPCPRPSVVGWTREPPAQTSVPPVTHLPRPFFPCHTTQVLLTMTVLMAPFTPFLTEFLYQRLREMHPNYKVTVPSSALVFACSVSIPSLSEANVCG